MTRLWTETDKMLVMVGKLSERIDILEFIQKKQDNEIERMRNVIRGTLAMPLPQRRKGRRRRERERL